MGSHLSRQCRTSRSALLSASKDTICCTAPPVGATSPIASMKRWNTPNEARWLSSGWMLSSGTNRPLQTRLPPEPPHDSGFLEQVHDHDAGRECEGRAVRELLDRIRLHH